VAARTDMVSSGTVALLAVGMLLSGTFNTISYKVADWQSAPGLYSPAQCSWDSGSNGTSAIDNADCKFVHPLVQVGSMFFGELLCLVVYGLLRSCNSIPPSPRFNVFVFLPCALCDMGATTLMLAGLLLTYPSDYQMLRGAVVFFTGIFSRVFLKRRLSRTKWVGIALVISGISVIGIDSVLSTETSAAASNPALGNLLILLAQVVVATQWVLEERFVQNVPPLLAVGLEGAFGVVALAVVCTAAYFLPGLRGFSETPARLEDAPDAFVQLGANALLLGATLCAIASIALFNCIGITVTKRLSAAHRMILDTARVVLVWIFSLIVHAVAPASGHGQTFSYVQLIGFVILVLGSLVYYEVVALPAAIAGQRVVRVAEADDALLDTREKPPPTTAPIVGVPIQ